MIRGFLALIMLLATPLMAFPVMQLTDCKAAWNVVIRTPSPDATYGVSDDGWCQVSTPEGGAFDPVEWRAENVQRVIEQSLAPNALAIRFSSHSMLKTLGLKVKADVPDVAAQIMLVLRENREAHQVLVETLQMAGPEGSVVSLRGVVHGVDLSNAAAMQASIGHARLRDLVLVATGNRKLEPYLRPYLGTTFAEKSRRRSAMMNKISDWPDHSFPAETKRAMQQLIAVLPTPNGTLEVVIDTGADLTVELLAQSFLFGFSAKGLGDRILNNTIFHATWTTE